MCAIGRIMALGSSSVTQNCLHFLSTCSEISSWINACWVYSVKVVYAVNFTHYLIYPLSWFIFSPMERSVCVHITHSSFDDRVNTSYHHHVGIIILSDHYHKGHVSVWGICTIKTGHLIDTDPWFLFSLSPCSLWCVNSLVHRSLGLYSLRRRRFISIGIIVLN